MADEQSNGKKREQADDEALVAFRELRARVELNDDGEAVSLDLLDSPVVDEHLQHLKVLTKLERVYLSGLTRITDAGLQHLTNLTNLKELDISGSVANPNRRHITDTGLEHLKGLTNLEKLSLNHTQITDAGLAHLMGLHSLKMLDLRNTMVTDLALEFLWRLKKLELLNLADTKVSAEGVSKLQKALPNCEIRR